MMIRICATGLWTAICCAAAIAEPLGDPETLAECNEGPASTNVYFSAESEWEVYFEERRSVIQNYQMRRQAESAAKAKRLGLWADPKPVNPYDWRKQNHPAAPDREYNKRKAKGNG